MCIRDSAKLGVSRGDTVAIMLSNRPEFHVVDLAVASLGATPYSIYQTYTPEQIEYLLNDADSEVAIVEQAYLPQVLAAREQAPALEHVIVLDGEAPEGTVPLADLEGSNPDFDVEASVATIQPLSLIHI